MTYTIGQIPTHDPTPPATAKIEIENPTGPTSEYSTLAEAAFGIGCLNFRRVAQTADYTLVNADKGALIELGGAAFYTLTVNAASGYDNPFAVLIYNSDTGRGKSLVINGISQFILWPLQSVVLINDNNIWVLAPRTQLWRPTTAPIFYMDNVTGQNDLSVTDGLASGAAAFATIGFANNTIDTYVAAQGMTVTIQCPTTTSVPISENVVISGSTPQGVSTKIIQGNPTTPSLCQWTCNGVACELADYASATLNGFKFESLSGGSLSVMAMSQNCIGDLTNNEFAGIGGGNALACSAFSTGNVLAGNKISGDLGSLAFASDGGLINCGLTIAISGTPHVSNALLSASTSGVIDVGGLAFSGATSSITGQQFDAQRGGRIVNDINVTWPSAMSAGMCLFGGAADRTATSLYDGSSTYSRLPASPTIGTPALVTDANVTALGAIVSSGGGSNAVLVWWDGADWLVFGGALVGTPDSGYFQLASSTSVSFVPFLGGLVQIAGVIYPIPSGGVTATISSCFVDGTAAQSLSYNTLYYVYVFNNSGTLALDFSTTGHSTDTTAGNVGVEVKTGVPSRTLVGMVYPQSGAVVDSLQFRLVASWFNRRQRLCHTLTENNSSITSSSLTELQSANRGLFLCWARQELFHGFINNGTLVLNTGSATVNFTIGIDGATNIFGNFNYAVSTTSVPGNMASMIDTSPGGVALTEGEHFVSLYASTTAGTLTANGRGSIALEI